MALEDREKKMLIGLGAVGGLVLVYVLFTKVLGGGAEPTPTPEPPLISSPGAPAGSGGASVGPGVPVTAQGPALSDRDIFSPIPEFVSSATPSTGASPSPGDSFTTGNEVDIDGHNVKIEDVITRRAPLVDTSVDGTSFRAAIGDKFATSFTVVTIDTSNACATYDYRSGTVSDTFTLCVR